VSVIRKPSTLRAPGLPRLTPLLAVIIPLAALLTTVGAFASPGAQTAPGLGSAASFAVLGGQTVTNTGPTTIFGDLGVSPGTAITGFPPGTVSGGATHAADAVALQAQSDVTIAYNALSAQACTADKTGQDLGGQTLTPGVYCSTSSAQLTGALTLDAQGNAAAVFIFKMVSTLTTASNSSVNVINGGTACNLYWQVGSSATVGTTTQFKGNILALTSIALQNGATIVPGRALARNGEVTMDNNNITILGCPGAQAAATATPAAATPTPAAATATPAAGQLPGTGGAPLESGGFPWPLVLVASVMGSLGAMLLGLSALRFSAQPHRRE
jgi:Ice-binding-like